MKLISKIKSWLFKEKELSFSLATNYRCTVWQTGPSWTQLQDWVLKDIKDQTYRLLREGKNKDVNKQLNKNKFVFLHIDFYINDQPSRHLLYYDGEVLYSPTMESTSLTRDIKLQELLK